MTGRPARHDDEGGARAHGPDALPLLEVADRAAWQAWLESQHASSLGVWLVIGKQGAVRRTVSYADALEVALCFGWIDGRKQRLDASAWLQKFTPRGPKSVWSRLNRERAEALIRTGEMRPAGLRQVERAKTDGRWADAYEPQRSAAVPDDLQAELDAHPAAREFFETLDSANRYGVLWRLQTARKPETRERRLRRFIEMLERHEKLHP